MNYPTALCFILVSVFSLTFAGIGYHEVQSVDEEEPDFGGYPNVPLTDHGYVVKTKADILKLARLSSVKQIVISNYVTSPGDTIDLTKLFVKDKILIMDTDLRGVTVKLYEKHYCAKVIVEHSVLCNEDTKILGQIQTLENHGRYVSR